MVSTGLNWKKRLNREYAADAQNQSGLMYQNGKGVPQDYAEAIKWYLKAAQSQKRFDQPVHPAGRAGVPRPSAAAGVRRERIDVGRDNVRFHFVSRNRLGRPFAWFTGLIMS
jgi:hypothetical protein